VRIDGTQGAGLNDPASGMGKYLKAPPAGAAKPAEAIEFDPVHRAYADKAAAFDAVDAAAVAEARKLLESSQLDTPEAAQRAADAILSRGL